MILIMITLIVMIAVISTKKWLKKSKEKEAKKSKWLKKSKEKEAKKKPSK